MYQNHTPKPQLPVDNPDFDSAPNADAGKSKMYKAHPGLPYSNGKFAGQKQLDVGSGVKAGTAQYTPHADPHWGSYRSRRGSTP